MKFINCGRVLYMILGSHIATIVYNFNNGSPSASIYYDGKVGEIVESTCGNTMRNAVKLARWTLRDWKYFETL